MDERNKLDGLKFLSQIHRNEHSERRKYEWKALLSCISYYVLLVVAVHGGEVHLPTFARPSLIALNLVLLVGSYFFLYNRVLLWF